MTDQKILNQTFFACPGDEVVMNNETQYVKPGFIQIPLLLVIIASVFATSGVGYVIYNRATISHTTKIDFSSPTPTPSLTPTPEVLGTSTPEITKRPVPTPNITPDPTSTPVTNQVVTPTYSIIPLGDISSYSSGHQTALNNAYSEFLRTPNLKYMNYQRQNDLLNSIIEKYIAQYKRELDQEIQQTKDNIEYLKSQLASPIPTSTPTPTPVVIYINPEIEAKLSELRQTLENIQNQTVQMSVIEGKKQKAYQDWVSNNPTIYSAILSSRYINDLNTIRQIYGV